MLHVAALGMRWEGQSALLKPSVIRNIARVQTRGVKGNFEGEGKLLGGLLVVGTGDSGVKFEHKEAVSALLSQKTRQNVQTWVRMFTMVAMERSKDSTLHVRERAGRNLHYECVSK